MLNGSGMTGDETGDIGIEGRREVGEGPLTLSPALESSIYAEVRRRRGVSYPDTDDRIPLQGRSPGSILIPGSHHHPFRDLYVVVTA
jgi:hypothetical protein